MAVVHRHFGKLFSWKQINDAETSYRAGDISEEMKEFSENRMCEDYWKVKHEFILPLYQIQKQFRVSVSSQNVNITICIALLQ